MLINTSGSHGNCKKNIYYRQESGENISEGVRGSREDKEVV